MSYEIIRLTDRPVMKERAAQWFHEKWGIPLEAYLESMEECLKGERCSPMVYGDGRKPDDRWSGRHRK